MISGMKWLLGVALVLCVMMPGATEAANLRWDAVTTDVTGAPEDVVSYNVYSRRLGSANTWVLLGSTAELFFPLPTPAAKQEYNVAALDAAANEGEASVSVTAHPNTPNNPFVQR